jgi:hypothetical protein
MKMRSVNWKKICLTWVRATISPLKEEEPLQVEADRAYKANRARKALRTSLQDALNPNSKESKVLNYSFRDSAEKINSLMMALR